MRGRHWISRLTLLSAILAAPAAEAGAWTQPQGDFYAKVWNRMLLGSAVYLSGRDIASLGKSYKLFEVSAYLEYGLTDELTMTIAGTPFGYASFEDESMVYAAGVGFGLRQALIRKPGYALSLEVRGGWRPPPNQESLGSGVVQGRSYVVTPVVPTAYFDIELQDGLGLPRGQWLSFNFGSRLFTNSELSPAALGYLQYGWASKFGLVFDAHLNFYHSVAEDEIVNVLGASNTRYLGFGIGLSFWFTKHFGINGAFEGVAYATANAATPAYNFGLEFR